MKSYTDLEQSKKLAEILPLESADMYYSFDYNIEQYDEDAQIIPKSELGQHFSFFPEDIPAWSLTALLGVLPTKLQIVLAINDFQGDRKEKYVIGSVEHDKYDCYADNPVDACVAMIEKLHEHKIL